MRFRKSRVLLAGVGVLLLSGIAVYFAYAKTDRTIPPLGDEDRKLLQEFQSLPDESRLSIAPDDEPGERLQLAMTFVDKATGQPLLGRHVHFYHASLAGEYEPQVPADESTARLSADAITDAAGRVFVETILPGDYGSSDDNRHIHTTVRNARPEAYDIHFSQYSTFMLRNFVAGSDQHFLATLWQTEDGRLTCFVTVEVKLADD